MDQSNAVFKLFAIDVKSDMFANIVREHNIIQNANTVVVEIFLQSGQDMPELST